MPPTHVGADLWVLPRGAFSPVLDYVVAAGDLSTVSDVDNLCQALWLRLATPKGDLAHLGHPTYGSRLHNLIGRLLTDQTISLAGAYVREAVRQEPRVQSIDNLNIRVDPVSRNTLIIECSVQPVSQATSVGFTLVLAVEPAPEGG